MRLPLMPSYDQLLQYFIFETTHEFTCGTFAESTEDWWSGYDCRPCSLITQLIPSDRQAVEDCDDIAVEEAYRQGKCRRCKRRLKHA